MGIEPGTLWQAGSRVEKSEKANEIRLTARGEGDNIVFEVHNNLQYKNISDLFLKKEYSTMSYLHVVLKAHRGTLRYEIDSGEGSTFYLTLPKQPEQPKK